MPSSTEVAHNGTHALQLTSTVSSQNKHVGITHNFTQPVFGEFSVWLFDTGADVGSSNSMWMELLQSNDRGSYTGVPDYDLGPGADGSMYVAVFDDRVVTHAVDRTRAWHKLSVNVSPDATTFQIDGSTIQVDRGSHPIKSVTLFLQAPSWRPAWTSYYDDFAFVPYGPDLVADSLAWNTTDGGVDFGYTISGANLTQATTAALYWSTDDKFDAGQDALISGSVTTTQTAVGTYGPIHVSAATLGTPPAGAKYLLAVVDPDNTVAESDESGGIMGPNNVKTLEPLPDITLGTSSWLPLEKGGGLEVSYFVKGADVPAGSVFQFYWSSDETLQSGTDTFAGSYLLGSTAHDESTPKTFDFTHEMFASSFGQPTPPLDAKYLLIIADAPTNGTPAYGGVRESNEDNNTEAIRLVPLVVNVVTHGFNPDGVLRYDNPLSINQVGWNKFWRTWDAGNDRLIGTHSDRLIGTHLGSSR